MECKVEIFKGCAIIHREDGVFLLALYPLKKKEKKKNPFFGTLFEMCYFSTAEVVYETAVVKSCWGVEGLTTHCTSTRRCLPCWILILLGLVVLFKISMDKINL